MVFPDSERVIFSNNPLEQVICQLRFQPILSITAKEPAEFQELIRQRHPGYERILSAIPKEIADLIALLPAAPSIPETTVFKFLTDDKKTEIDLTRDFVAVATTNYVRWEDFASTIDLATHALESIYKPAFYTRIGLRYRNVIDRAKCGLTNVPYNELVKKSVAGLLDEPQVDIASKITASETQTLIDLDQPSDHLVMRNGLMPKQGEDRRYAIDADFYSEGNIAIGQVLPILGRFHNEARNLFNWIITPRLRNALGPTPAT